MTAIFLVVLLAIFHSSLAQLPEPPATFQELLVLLQGFPVNDVNVFTDEDSAQYKAAIWATEEDTYWIENNNSGEDDDEERVERLLRRYALATFYFATGGNNWTQCIRSSCSFIIDNTFVREADETVWLSSSTECSWVGFQCAGSSDGTSLKIDFDYYSIGDLVGSIPDDFYLLEQLEEISIVGNSKMVGTISPFIGQLTQLSKLQLSSTGISGAIPSEIKQLTQLTSLLFAGTNLSGTIPSELGRMTQLERLSLRRNSGLTGAIPSEVGQMAQLTTLVLSGTGISGPIPVELFSLASLEEFLCAEANLTGTLSESFRLLNSSLDYLDLAKNQLEGPIPEAFDYLTNLDILLLNGNDLTGTISDILCSRGLFQLFVDCTVSCDCCRCFTPSPTSSPTVAPSPLELESLIAKLGDLEVSTDFQLLNQTSPQYDAVTWLAEEAGDYFSNDTKIVQRFALATLYFATDGVGWEVASTSSDGNGWLTSTEECTWYAVSCKNGRVVELNFSPESGIVLNGILPPELFLLTALEVLSIAGYSDLSGTISSHIRQLTALNTLTFLNTGLSGTMLEDITQLTQLSNLRLDTNRFTGTIPPDISGLFLLSMLDLGNNSLLGSLPVDLFELSVLEYLVLSNNPGINGTISTYIGGLSMLRGLSMENTSISGTMPEELFGLASLNLLDLQSAQFYGTISENIRLLNTTLMDLFLNYNRFSGPIPEAFDYLTALEVLHLHGNQLTGSISQAVCLERGLRWQQLASLFVDCNVSCDCCDFCLEPVLPSAAPSMTPSTAPLIDLSDVNETTQSNMTEYAGDNNSTGDESSPTEMPPVASAADETDPTDGVTAKDESEAIEADIVGTASNASDSHVSSVCILWKVLMFTAALCFSW